MPPGLYLEGKLDFSRGVKVGRLVLNEAIDEDGDEGVWEVRVVFVRTLREDIDKGREVGG